MHNSVFEVKTKKDPVRKQGSSETNTTLKM